MAFLTPPQLHRKASWTSYVHVENGFSDSSPTVQDSVPDKADVDVQRKAALDEQAAALRAKMTESHLATFRSEAKNRWAPEQDGLQCMRRILQHLA